ncbi:hypothetical protein MEPL4_4c02090 [Melissococcus plutonius]|uniref:Uncharacterized protein n=2 Tax=Melissococcus plutonius TaxID=33970 RepID=F3YB17_MELPT|nr:hypothetical protein MEPL_c011910 [Melissococcus plutonius S1]KMT25372.1 hypothetical protein MEPL2_2c09380 [Melissococcus plutonius]BAK21695.1 hypothetical protein MPTP_1244 [Melissococcus plutonius ATCC 35311]KMT25641.1 hypothetical protein MEPL3_4c00410 [Melissococcus plutonius]KMT26276.1 hypothetical protein MEPL1_5c00410 [Melissococcus plutonius]
MDSIQFKKSISFDQKELTRKTKTNTKELIKKIFKNFY